MKKGFKAVLTSFFIILSAGVVIDGIVWYMLEAAGKGGEVESVRAMNELAYNPSEVTVDLKDERFVHIRFNVVIDGKKAETEMADRESQVRKIKR